MDTPVEFSKFYRVLNAAKEGEEGKSLELESLLKEYEASEKSASALHQLGEIFLYVGIMELYKYSGTQDIQAIGVLNKEDWKNYCKKISEISNRLDDVGLPISYHEHMGTIIQTEADLEKFIENTNENTKLLYDTGHLLFAKSNYENILKKYISRINHVHCKDIRKDILEKSLDNDLSFRDSFLEGVFTVPGDGCIDYNPLIKILYKNNYQNWLVIEAEQDPIKANPLKYAKIGYNYLSNLLNQIGYKF